MFFHVKYPRISISLSVLMDYVLAACTPLLWPWNLGKVRKEHGSISHKKSV
jgi:hypothetical protein